VFMTGEMIRVWNEPVVADFKILFYFVHKSLMSCFWTQFKAVIFQGCEASTKFYVQVPKV